MKKLFLFSLAMIIAVFTACGDQPVDAGDELEKSFGENFTFYKSELLAEETESNRATDISDPFEINEVWIEDDGEKKWMHIEVTQELGCEESYAEKFEVIWDGIMLMIYPPQVGFYLSLNTDGCSDLVENVTETITLDLYELFGDEGFVDSAEFTVLNASKNAGENDYEVDR